MTKSEKLRKELEAAEQAKAEAQGKINALQAKRESAMTALGDRLMSEPNASTTELDELQAELERLELKAQAYDRRLGKLRAELASTKEAEKQAEIDKLIKEAEPLTRAVLKQIYSLYDNSGKLLRLLWRYQSLTDDFRSRAISLGIPIEAVSRYTENWLNAAEVGAPELKTMMIEENIPNRLERAKRGLPK